MTANSATALPRWRWPRAAPAGCSSAAWATLIPAGQSFPAARWSLRRIRHDAGLRRDRHPQRRDSGELRQRTWPPPTTSSRSSPARALAPGEIGALGGFNFDSTGGLTLVAGSTTDFDHQGPMRTDRRTRQSHAARQRQGHDQPQQPRRAGRHHFPVQLRQRLQQFGNSAYAGHKPAPVPVADGHECQADVHALADQHGQHLRRPDQPFDQRHGVFQRRVVRQQRLVGPGGTTNWTGGLPVAGQFKNYDNVAFGNIQRQRRRSRSPRVASIPAQ